MHAKAAGEAATFSQAELFQNCYVTNVTTVAAQKTKKFAGTFAEAAQAGARACGSIASSVMDRQKAINALQRNVALANQQLENVAQTMTLSTDVRLRTQKFELEIRKFNLEEFARIVEALPKPYGQRPGSADTAASTWTVARRLVRNDYAN